MKQVTREEWAAFLEQFPHAVASLSAISEPPMVFVTDETGMMPDSLLAKHQHGTDNYWIADPA